MVKRRPGTPRRKKNPAGRFWANRFNAISTGVRLTPNRGSGRPRGRARLEDLSLHDQGPKPGVDLTFKVLVLDSQGDGTIADTL